MITIEYNDAQVTTALQQLFDQIGDASGIMSEIGDHLVVSAQKRLDEEISPEGMSWAPRSEATIVSYERRAKKSKGPGSWGGILTYSGQMGRSLKHEFGPDFVVVGTPEPYAAMMQFGGTKAAFPHLWGNIPARPFLGVSEDDKDAILDIVHEALARAFGGA